MNWRTEYSPNVALKVPLMGGIFMFKFPAQDGVHYIVQPQSTKSASSISATYLIKGTNPVFKPISGDPPATVRLYFQRKDDDMQGTRGTTEFYRWWSNQIYLPLSVGSFSLEAPLQPSYWSSVWGERGDQNLRNFWDAWRNVESVGMTFGAVNQFGHGVCLSSGSAKFVLKSFKVL